MSSHSRAYLDTNVFIDVIEGGDSVSQPIKALFEAARRGALVTSELTLAEALAPAGGGRRTADLPRAYLDLIVWSRVVDLRPVTRDILLETARLREFVRHKLPDAIHLVTATRADCRYFISRDQDFDRMPEGIERIGTEPEQLARVSGALR